MNKEPLVSVIMNCFNGEKYLREAIDSVLSQTFSNWEIIFWDNQSVDSSAEILKSYSDSRLKYFYAPTHTFLYEARNYAIEKASGNFFAFLDVDDSWLPQKLEKQIPLFLDPQVGMVCGNYWVVNERKKKEWIISKSLIPTGQVLNELLTPHFPRGLLTLVVRKAAFEALSYPCDPRYHVIGDFDLMVRLSVNWKLDCVQEPIARYRIHDNNETAKHVRRHLVELECWMADMCKVPTIRSSRNWNLVGNNYTYLKALLYVLSGNRYEACNLFSELPWGKLKLRLLLALCTPLWIIQKVKN